MPFSHHLGEGALVNEPCVHPAGVHKDVVALLVVGGVENRFLDRHHDKLDGQMILPVRTEARLCKFEKKKGEMKSWQ